VTDLSEGKCGTNIVLAEAGDGGNVSGCILGTRTRHMHECTCTRYYVFDRFNRGIGGTLVSCMHIDALCFDGKSRQVYVWKMAFGVAPFAIRCMNMPILVHL
jgi:hypothetical protein